MTINRNFDTVTLWDVKKHDEYILHGRIKEGEEKYLKHYLSPVLTEEEKKKFKAEREANKALDTMGDGDAQSEFDGDDDDEEDVENSDSDFQEKIQKIVIYSEMDQTLKGDNINLIGKIDGLGIEK